jgi:hypothetical protein
MSTTQIQTPGDRGSVWGTAGSGKSHVPTDYRSESADLESFDIDSLLAPGHEPEARQVLSPYAIWSELSKRENHSIFEAPDSRRASALPSGTEPIAVPGAKPAPVNPMMFDATSLAVGGFVGTVFAARTALAGAAMPIGGAVAFAWSKLWGYKKYGR